MSRREDPDSALDDVIRAQVSLAEAAETINERAGDRDIIEKRLLDAVSHIDLALRHLGLDTLPQ